MKVTFLTPGTGSYYCGACMRDNALARELHRTGHDVTIAPMYLPLMVDDAKLAGLEQTPIFFGGINVYLQQKMALFRKTPAVFDRLLNSKTLLRWAARHSHMTSAREHGELTLAMLNLEESGLRKESEKLFEWLEQSAKPDLVCLSNALLAGFIGEIKRRIGAPVVAFFQGEDSFLDGLPEPYRSKCWTTMGERLGAADRLIAPSRFYAEFMCERLSLPPAAIEVVPNGISLDGYTVATTAPTTPTIGYLARMTRDKGLELLIDAFVVLAGELKNNTARLKIAGAVTAGDEPFIARMKQRLANEGLTSRVDWAPNLTLAEKHSFLRDLTLFSVPAIYAEAFGLYVIEAMAAGVPVVQPESAAFPEMVAATGGGICVKARDAHALARGWQQLLDRPDERERLSRAARMGVERNFTARTMSAQFCEVAHRLVRATA